LVLDCVGQVGNLRPIGNPPVVDFSKANTADDSLVSSAFSPRS